MPTVADLLSPAPTTQPTAPGSDSIPAPPPGFVPANDAVPAPPPGFIPEGQAPKRSLADYAGMYGVRAPLRGVEGLADMAQQGVEAASNPVLGAAKIGARLFGLTPAPPSYADQAADALKLAKPVTPGEKLIDAGIQGAVQGVITGGAGAAEGTVARMLGGAAREAVTGGAAGVAANATQQAGLPAPVQLAAGVAAGLVTHRGVASVAAKFGPKLANVVAEAPRDTVLTPKGELTEDGREIAAQNGVHPDQVKAAYDHFDEVQAKTANDNPDLPPAEAPAMAVGDGLNRSTAEEPPVNTAPQEAVPGAAASGEAPPPEPPSSAAERVAEAQSEGVDLSKGQATQDFTTQEQEETLRRTAGTEEGAKAQSFFAKQQQQIADAIGRFKAALGNPDATAEERGAQIQDALRTLRDQGKAGINALYKKAQEMAQSLGDAGSNLTRLDTAPLLAKMRELFLDETIPAAVREALKQQAAKYGLIGEEPTTVEGETTVKLRDQNGDLTGRKTFTGPVEPLTIANAEALRQKINSLFEQDTSKLSQGLKPILDDAVQQAIERAATEAPGGVGEAFKAARKGFQLHQAIFKAKDIIQSLVDWKNGATGTPKISPDQVIKKILGNDPDSITSLKRVKAVLLNKATEQSRAAWDAISAHVIGKIFDKATVLNSNAGDGSFGSISGAKLNSAIEAFGHEKLKIVLSPEHYNQLMKLNRIIRNATVPIEGAVNKSGSAYTMINFLAKQGLKLASVGRFVPGVGPLADVAAHVVRSSQQSARNAKTLKGIREYDLTQAANEDAKGAKPDAGKFVSDFIRTARDPNIVAPILAASSTQSTEEPTR